MNQSKIARSEVCQTCAKCCKEFWWVVHNRDWAKRLQLLNRRDISVEWKYLSASNQTVWIVKIKHSCSALTFKKGKYYCEIWDKSRPRLCEEYPDNIPMTEWKAHPCPLLKDYKCLK